MNPNAPQVNSLRSLTYTRIDDGSFDKAVANVIRSGNFSANQLEGFYRSASTLGIPGAESRSYAARAAWIRRHYLVSR
jgi:hypothetical protein